MSLPIVKRQALEYQTVEGRSPFNDWICSLRDIRAKAKITRAVTQMEAGNFGDRKVISQGQGLYERRIHNGPGYRIYYICDHDHFIILFGGSDKGNQDQAIQAAKSFLKDYRARQNAIGQATEGGA
ncbi:MAG TPA: type II toxin-antitoxin system RelE/ParE family toxin [Orrella sp.]